MPGVRLSLIGFISLVLAVSAQEKLATLQVGSVVYSNVLVTLVTPTDIYFSHDKGIGNAKLKNLAPALQEHFHFNADTARDIEQKQAGANLQYTQELIRKDQAQRDAAAERLKSENAARALAANAAAAQAGEAPTGKKIYAKSFLNQHAPALVVEKWLTEEPDYRGKCVLLDFWATWCPPCRATIPELNAWHKKFGGKLVVIGLSNEPEATVRNMTDPKIDYFVGIDTQDRTAKAVGVNGIPHVMFMDPQGIVRWEGFPLMQGYALTENVVADLLAKYSK